MPDKIPDGRTKWRLYASLFGEHKKHQPNNVKKNSRPQFVQLIGKCLHGLLFCKLLRWKIISAVLHVFYQQTVFQCTWGREYLKNQITATLVHTCCRKICFIVKIYTSNLWRWWFGFITLSGTYLYKLLSIFAMCQD